MIIAFFNFDHSASKCNLERLPHHYAHYYRQRTLDEALLFSGQLKEALAALLDWLYKVEPALSDVQPLHGDLDTVSGLLEGHKVCEHAVSVPPLYVIGCLKFIRKDFLILEVLFAKSNFLILSLFSRHSNMI